MSDNKFANMTALDDLDLENVNGGLTMHEAERGNDSPSLRGNDGMAPNIGSAARPGMGGASVNRIKRIN